MLSNKVYRLFITLFIALTGIAFSLAVLSLTPVASVHAAPPAASLAQSVYTPTVVITQPKAFEVITATRLPIYPVLLEVTPECGAGGSGCMPPTGSLQVQLVSITIRSLETEQVVVDELIATSPITQRKTLTYFWALPISDSKQFVLRATAVNSQPIAGVSAPITVTVDTATLHPLEVNVVGLGTVTKTPSQTDYISGTVVTLTAKAADKWWFEQWSGDLPDGPDNLPQIIMTMTEDKALTATFRTTTSIFLPVVLKNYTPPKALNNGDFQSGDLSGWDYGPGTFEGHGSGLPQGVTSIGGGEYAALLGNKAYDGNAHNGTIPVGYGAIAQSFTVITRYVQIKYHVSTYDFVRSAKTGRYFDTFEVSLNASSAEINDSERNAKGCASTILNPTGVLVPGEGLVLCGGHNGTEGGSLHDLGWKTVHLDMAAYQGERITLYFTVWNREYVAPDWDDKGYFNTWVELNDISMKASTQ